MHYSDAVAAQTLVHRGERELVFGHRARFVGVLSFGSWGAVITVPMTMLFVSGELPPAGLMSAVFPIYAIGLALVYLAVRSLVNGSRLEVDGPDLRFRRRPLWPFRERRIALGSIAGTLIELRPDSFLHPATYRGQPAVRPYVVHVCHRDGTRTTLPLALGARDAEAVAAWIERVAR